MPRINLPPPSIFRGGWEERRSAAYTTRLPPGKQSRVQVSIDPELAEQSREVARPLLKTGDDAPARGRSCREATEGACLTDALHAAHVAGPCCWLIWRQATSYPVSRLVQILNLQLRHYDCSQVPLLSKLKFCASFESVNGGSYE